MNFDKFKDCVSREAVLDVLHVEGRPTKRFDYVIDVKRDIMALPPVIPIDLLLDEIKAEIDRLPSELTYDGRRMIRRARVYDIIDKYREKVY